MSASRKGFGPWLLVIALNYGFGQMALAPFGPRAKGDGWEWFRCGVGLAGTACVVIALGVVIVTGHRLSLRVRRLTSRPRLSNEEFAAMLSDPDRIGPAAIANARALAETHLQEHGGAWIYPTDRLEEDLLLSGLHRRDRDDFCRNLAKSLGIRQDDMKQALASRTITTFGDLIQAVAESNQPKAKPKTKAHPLWDRDLDV